MRPASGRTTRVGGDGDRRAAAPPTSVRHDADASRYVALLDGEEAGFAEYRRQGDTVTFTHTVVDPAHEGEGVGSALVRTALDDARAQGLAVLPRCSFVQGYLARHPDDVALVPEDQRAAHGLG